MFQRLKSFIVRIKQPSKLIIRKKANTSSRGTKYPVNSTTLSEMNSHFFPPLTSQLLELKKRFKNLRIVDLGCGEGTAVMQLAKGNPDCSFIGVSKESSKNWKNSRNLKFLEISTKNLVEKLRKKPVHLVFAYYSLTHSALFGEFKKDVLALREGLVIGGRISFAPLEHLALMDELYTRKGNEGIASFIKDMKNFGLKPVFSKDASTDQPVLSYIERIN